MSTSCSITDDTSELLDALGYSGDNRGKDVGANVRLGIPQNIAGAPASTKVSRIRRWADLVPVLSLPSEKVPAPPRPNWILLSGSRMRSFRKRSIAREQGRRVAALDEQGLKTCFGERKRSERPAHPAPTTTGRS